MTAANFRRIALSFPGAAESAHMGAPDFRVDGRIFATLAHESKGYGNLMLTPEAQEELLADSPGIFLPVAGGWGRKGATHVVLAQASEGVLRAALAVAYELRVAKNTKRQRKRATGA